MVLDLSSYKFRDFCKLFYERKERAYGKETKMMSLLCVLMYAELIAIGAYVGGKFSNEEGS